MTYVIFAGLPQMITNRHRKVVTPEQACPGCEALFLFKGGSLTLSRMEVEN